MGERWGGEGKGTIILAMFFQGYEGTVVGSRLLIKRQREGLKAKESAGGFMLKFLFCGASSGMYASGILNRSASIPHLL